MRDIVRAVGVALTACLVLRVIAAAVAPLIPLLSALFVTAVLGLVFVSRRQ